MESLLLEWLPWSVSEWAFPTRKRSGPWINGSCGSRPVDALRRAGEAAGVTGLTWKSLRHTWATHAETAWGIPELGVQRVLRHTTPLTQRHYRHPDMVNLRRMVDSVSFPEFDGGPPPQAAS
jgi:integrase